MKSSYVWERNIWTGNDLAPVPGKPTQRLVRMGNPTSGYLYNAEEWGDYSSRFPVHGGWYATPSKALTALKREIEKQVAS